jgi:hypothetical protein
VAVVDARLFSDTLGGAGGYSAGKMHAGS